MADYPQDWHYPQAAGTAEPPASIGKAVRLMYAGAGIAVVLGITAALTTHSSRRVVHIGNPASGTYKAGEIIGGVLTGLIVGGLWLWMAWANKRARSWARILSTVFFCVLTLYAAGSLASTLPVAFKIVVILEWVAGIAAIVFLWLRQSSQYYKAVSQPAGYPPVPWGQQYGQQPYAQQPDNPSSYDQRQPPQYGQPPAQSHGQPRYRHPGQHLDQPTPPSPS